MQSRMETSRLTHPTSLKPRTWGEWWSGTGKHINAASSTDCAQNLAVQGHLRQMLDHVEPPETFKLSAVAQMLTPKELEALGYQKWEQALPGCRELAFEWREFGHLDILRKGEVLPGEVEFYEVDYPVRIRRRTGL